MPTKMQPDPAPAPGVHDAVDAVAYHRWDAWNASTLKNLSVMSPGSLRRKMNRSADDPGGSLIFGSLVHTRLLEPEKFPSRDRFVVIDRAFDRSTKGRVLNVDTDSAGWAWAQREAGEGVAVGVGWLETLDAMAAAVERNPEVSAVLRDAREGRYVVERSMVWEDRTGLLCKARVDLLRPHGRIVDLKTSYASAPSDFTRVGLRNPLLYHCSLAHYQMGAEACGCGDAKMPADIIWLPRPKNMDDPDARAECVAVLFEVADDLLAFGRSRVREWLDLVARCYERDEWPEWPSVMPMAAPVWMIRDFTDGEDQ